MSSDAALLIYPTRALVELLEYCSYMSSDAALLIYSTRALVELLEYCSYMSSSRVDE
jgi:ATP-dependent helicase YprA (DUF1998 family)